MSKKKGDHLSLVRDTGSQASNAAPLVPDASQSNIKPEEVAAIASALFSAGGNGSGMPPFQNTSGGGGPGGPGMEARVAVLEAEVKHIRVDLDKLTGVPVDVATIKEKIAHLPGKGFVVTAALGTITGLSGVLVVLSKLGFLSAGH